MTDKRVLQMPAAESEMRSSSQRPRDQNAHLRFLLGMTSSVLRGWRPASVDFMEVERSTKMRKRLHLVGIIVCMPPCA